MSTIKAFHATGDLDSIITDREIRAPWFLGGNEEDWRRDFEAYDRLTKATGREVRAALRNGWLKRSHFKISMSDEALTDSASEHPKEWPFEDDPEKTEYKELKRNLFVFLYTDSEGARSFISGRLRPQSFSGVLEIDLPVERIRPTYYPLEVTRIILVPKSVSLDSLTRVYVQAEDLGRASKLLTANRFENVKVEELK